MSSNPLAPYCYYLAEAFLEAYGQYKASEDQLTRFTALRSSQRYFYYLMRLPAGEVFGLSDAELEGMRVRLETHITRELEWNHVYCQALQDLRALHRLSGDRDDVARRRRVLVHQVFASEQALEAQAQVRRDRVRDLPRAPHRSRQN